MTLPLARAPQRRRSLLPTRAENARPAQKVETALAVCPAFSENTAEAEQQSMMSTINTIRSFRGAGDIARSSSKGDQSSRPFPFRMRSTFFSMRASRVVLCLAPEKWSR